MCAHVQVAVSVYLEDDTVHLCMCMCTHMQICVSVYAEDFFRMCICMCMCANVHASVSVCRR